MGSDDKNGNGEEEKELEIIKCVIELFLGCPGFYLPSFGLAEGLP